MDEAAKRDSARMGRRKVQSYVAEAQRDLEAIERLADLDDMATVLDGDSHRIVAEAFTASQNLVTNFRNMGKVLGMLLLHESIRREQSDWGD